MNKTENNVTYKSPVIEIVELKVEKGFALSPTDEYNEDQMDLERINDWW